MRPLAALGILLVGCLSAPAQDTPQTDGPPPAPSSGAVMVQLFGPKYPPLAQSARIAGEVELKLRIRKDGSINSVVLVSGHPMLTQAALDSARQSRFECPGCADEVTTYSLIYSFQIIAGPDFPCPKSYQHVTQSGNRVTITGEPRLASPILFSSALASGPQNAYICGDAVRTGAARTTTLILCVRRNAWTCGSAVAACENHTPRVNVCIAKSGNKSCYSHDFLHRLLRYTALKP